MSPSKGSTANNNTVRDDQSLNNAGGGSSAEKHQMSNNRGGKSGGKGIAKTAGSSPKGKVKRQTSKESIGSSIVGGGDTLEESTGGGSGNSPHQSKNNSKLISKAELNKIIDTQIMQHELIEDNEDYLTVQEFNKINFKFGLPIIVSDLVHYLTGKHMSVSPTILEEEAEKDRIKHANLLPVFERDICPGPFFD